MKYNLCIILLIVPLLFVSNIVKAEDNHDKWALTLTPNLWLPTIEADIKYTTLPNGSSGSPHVEVDPDDWLKNLDFGALINTEIRKGKWLLMSDLVYMKLSSSDSNVKAINFGGSIVTTSLDIRTDVEVQSFLTTVVGGYNLIDGKYLKTDVIAGFRYLWLEADLDWSLSAAVSGPRRGDTFARSGSLSQDEDVWNGVGGVKGRINLGDSNWTIPYYADIGAGDSELTWQVFSGLEYSFGSWEIGLGYRHLVFDGGDSDLITDLTLTGPVIGASFSF